jgi:hypothetical protein
VILLARIKSVISVCDRDTLQELLDTSSSYSDILSKFGLVRSGSSYNILKNIISDYALDETKFELNRQTNAHPDTTKIELAQILIKNSTYSSNKELLLRLCRAGLKSWQCECCGITEWQGKDCLFIYITMTEIRRIMNYLIFQFFVLIVIHKQKIMRVKKLQLFVKKVLFLITTISNLKCKLYYSRA